MGVGGCHAWVKTQISHTLYMEKWTIYNGGKLKHGEEDGGWWVAILRGSSGEHFLDEVIFDKGLKDVTEFSGRSLLVEETV